jgi:hypothetical protein
MFILETIKTKINCRKVNVVLITKSTLTNLFAKELRGLVYLPT